jgi:hypothetical protein
VDELAVLRLIFPETGIKGLAEQNGLDEKQNAKLFHTPVLDRAIQFVLTALVCPHRTRAIKTLNDSLFR